jgi:hypothetical protein
MPAKKRELASNVLSENTNVAEKPPRFAAFPRTRQSLLTRAPAVEFVAAAVETVERFVACAFVAVE